MADVKDLLQQVLDEAHASHVYVADEDKYGVPEHWEVDLEGDCEDFALAVRAELADIGIPSDLVLCQTENGIGHLVVSVDGWILDNRHAWVIAQQDLPYTWLKLGEPDGTWYEIVEPSA